MTELGGQNTRPRDTQQADVATVPRFANIATFMRVAQSGTAEGLDVAMFGVPFDLGSSFRSGSRHGPSEIREMSRLIREVNYATGTAPFQHCRVADIGDAPVNSLDVDESLSAIETFVADVVACGARPLAAGGDHTITLPILRALAQDGPLALVQIDAHSDTQDVMLGRDVANGTVFRRAIEEGLLEPRLCFQIGIRGTLFKADELAWARDAGVTIFDMDDFEDLGAQEITARMVGAIKDHATYLTFDVDALDPAVAPGTGGLEPGGLSYRDALKLMHGIRGLNLAGADVVEICPPLEPGNLTAMVAANIMFEELCLLAEAKDRST
ncbi:MAG: agmatinase [Pseudomonadota bacterium]